MEVRPQSHVDTPEWQSFEARMLTRRAERRAQAARVRRARLAKGAGVLALLLVAATVGFTGVWLMRQPIAFTATPPVAPPQIALRTNGGVAPLPLVDAEAVPILETPPLPAFDVTTDGDTTAAPTPRPIEPRRTENSPPAPRASEAAAPNSVSAARPAPAQTPATGEVFRNGVNERAIPPPPQPVPPPAAAEPDASPVTAVPGTRESAAAPSGPTAVGTAGSAAAAPGLAIGAETPVPPAVPAASTVRAQPDPRSAIRSLLERYRTAYERLDAAAASEVWPGVDRRALARAFSSLESQQIDFRECQILTAAATAHVTCTGRARAVPKIGSGGASEADRTWDFSLVQKGSEWQIAKATVK